MNISYEPNFSMRKFHENRHIQILVDICLNNYYNPIFDDIVGAITSPNEESLMYFLNELENRYVGTPNFNIFSTYKFSILMLFKDSQIKNLKGAFLEVLAFKILERHYHPHITCTDCKVLINLWKSDLTVDIAMEYDSLGLCCECKVPTSKFTWDIFKNLLDIKMKSQNYFNVYAITLSDKKRMDAKKRRITEAVEDSIGIIDEVHCITRDSIVNFNV